MKNIVIYKFPWGGGGGVNICLHDALCSCPFKLFGGDVPVKYCYHVAAFMIPFNLICNMTMF